MDQQHKYAGPGPLPRSTSADDANSIVVGGALVPVGTRVVKWYEAGGFDGYAERPATVTEEDRRTGKVTTRTFAGKRYNRRPAGIASIRQIFIHHTGGDGDGARNVYETLHNQRKLSVHFVVDDDGLAWQMLDVAECAWHAGSHNPCAVGFECALFPSADENPTYYSAERNARNHNQPHRIVTDVIHGTSRRVFAFTSPQVEALAQIAVGLWRALGREPSNRAADAFKLPPRFPHDAAGEIPRTVVPNALQHAGLIGHLQCTLNKWDPAGFPWDAFEGRVAALYRVPAAGG